MRRWLLILLLIASPLRAENASECKIADQDSLAINTTQLSAIWDWDDGFVSFWLRLHPMSLDQTRLIRVGASSTNDVVRLLWNDSQDRVEVSILDNGGNAATNTTADAAEDDSVWRHVAFKWDQSANQITTYVNAVQQNTNSWGGGVVLSGAITASRACSESSTTFFTEMDIAHLRIRPGNPPLNVAGEAFVSHDVRCPNRTPMTQPGSWHPFWEAGSVTTTDARGTPLYVTAINTPVGISTGPTVPRICGGIL